MIYNKAHQIFTQDDIEHFNSIEILLPSNGGKLKPIELIIQYMIDGFLYTIAEKSYQKFENIRDKTSATPNKYGRRSLVIKPLEIYNYLDYWDNVGASGTEKIVVFIEFNENNIKEILQNCSYIGLGSGNSNLGSKVISMQKRLDKNPHLVGIFLDTASNKISFFADLVTLKKVFQIIVS